MIDLRDIYSLSDFQRNTREHIQRLKTCRRPEVLTVNGKAELVVQDAGSYQLLIDSLAREMSAAPVGAPRLEPDPVVETYKEDVDRTLVRENLGRSVSERLEGLLALQRLAAEARRAGQAAGHAAGHAAGRAAGQAAGRERSGQ